MWVGLVFFLKTYMVIIPLIAISPFVFFYKRNLLSKKPFYLGFLLGFLPFIIWSIFCFNLYGTDFIYGINNKLLSLSKSNTFSQPFYYYLWNLPISFLPWTPFCLYGIRLVKNNLNPKKSYFILIYPLFLIFLLSLFSTKVPYYSLQAFPFLSICTSYGLLHFSYNFNSKRKRFINKISFFLLSLVLSSLIYLFIKKETIIQEEIIHIFIFLSAILLLISPLLIFNIFSQKKLKIFVFLLGPYLSILLLVQTGQLSNRSPDIRIAIDNLDKSELNNNYQTFILTPLKIDGEELSELIKIALYSKKNLKRVNDISEVKLNQYVWITTKNLEQIQDFTPIYKDKRISKWVLAKKS